MNIQDSKNMAFDQVAETARLNEEGLWRTCQEFGIRLTTDSKDLGKWRATTRASGSISGMPWSMRILLTDGCVAWFQKEGDGALFFGHVEEFDGEVKPLFSLPKTLNRREACDPATRKTKISKPKPNPLQAAKDLLESILDL